MTTKAADDMSSIARRLKEIEAEKAARINGMPLEDAKPVEAPKDIDWTGMYGYPCGFYAVSPNGLVMNWASIPAGQVGNYATVYKKTEI